MANEGKPQTEFIFIIPRSDKYIHAFNEFLNNRKFQIHKLIMEEEKATYVMSIYFFTPQQLIDYLVFTVPKEDRDKHALPRFSAKPKKTKRGFNKKKMEYWNKVTKNPVT